MKKKEPVIKRKILLKAPTSIHGFDEITGGGLPKGRPTLVCGGAGCGKTLFAMEFIVRGAQNFNEPGIFISFEENDKELIANVSSLGFDLEDLIAKRKVWIEHIDIEPELAKPGGQYDLNILFLQIHNAIESIGAKRVVLDTIEYLFMVLPNPIAIRSQLRRLFKWLKKKGVTAIITGERGDNTLTRQGLEEYVSDCVILLDHRVNDQSSIRRLRIVKYRGSTHGTNEYPFIIDEEGFSVLPVTSLGLDYFSSPERISTGIPRLDTMLSGKGFYRGSTILVSGSAGTGKTSLAAQFIDAACRRGERALFFIMEESQNQLLRNMRSIGIDLNQWVKKGLLLFSATRPTLYGLETHLANSIKLVNKFKPAVVVLDPINSFVIGKNIFEVNTMLVRLVDFLKMKRVTALFTSNTANSYDAESSDVYVSSLIDSWILLMYLEKGGERNRGLEVLKSRGMPHSNQVREMIITSNGIDLIDVCIGPEGVVTGSARIAQRSKDAAEQLFHQQEVVRKKSGIERKRIALEAQIEVLRAEFENHESEVLRVIGIERTTQSLLAHDREKMSKTRGGDNERKKKPVRKK